MNDARKVALRVEIKSRKGLTASYLGITAHFSPPPQAKGTGPYQFHDPIFVVVLHDH